MRLVEAARAANAASTPSAAGAASGPRRRPSQISRSTSFGRQHERRAAVGADHQPGAGLGEAGQVVEVAAVAVGVVVVAVALPLGRGRHDRDAAAGRAQRLGDRGAARRAKGEASEVIAATVAAGAAIGLCASLERLRRTPRGPSHEHDLPPSRRAAACRSARSRSARGSRITTRSTPAPPREMLAAAMDAGVNFFDNAEVYAQRPERGR